MLAVGNAGVGFNAYIQHLKSGPVMVLADRSDAADAGNRRRLCRFFPNSQTGWAQWKTYNINPVPNPGYEPSTSLQQRRYVFLLTA